MTLVAYIVLFIFVAIMGAGLPGLGDASLIAAGARAGEGRLDIWIVLAAAMVAWMLGSVAGYRDRVPPGTRAARAPGVARGDAAETPRQG